jgi:hypothetical protein
MNKRSKGDIKGIVRSLPLEPNWRALEDRSYTGWPSMGRKVLKT